MSQVSKIPEDRLKKLVLAGLTIGECAQVLGVVPTTISDYLRTRPEFTSDIKAALADKHTRDSEIYDIYGDIELTALERLKEKVVYMHETRELLAVVSVMSKAAKDRAGKDLSQAAVSTLTNKDDTIIDLDMTPPEMPGIVSNANGKILEIEGIELTTISLKELNNEIDTKAEEGLKALEQETGSQDTIKQISDPR